MNKTLLIATGNSHKAEEIQAMLGNEVEVKDLRSLPEIGEIIEDADTFEGNADIKALTVSQLTDELVLADDSGLAVDALNGAPGIRSARYAGDHATMAENKVLLLKDLVGVESRKARFVCVLSLAKDGEVLARFRGECLGRIISEEVGEGGFGYDPLFIPEGYEQTFAELSAETKNSISHRAVAFQKFQEWYQANA